MPAMNYFIHFYRCANGLDIVALRKSWYTRLLGSLHSNRHRLYGPVSFAPVAPCFAVELFCDQLYILVYLHTLLSQVVELQPGSSVFVEQGAPRNIETTCKTATATARSLLTVVFTQQALLVSSVKGNKAKGMHRPSEQRPPLHCGGIAASLGKFLHSFRLLCV